jgi:ATP-dependent DNA helicase DinG
VVSALAGAVGALPGGGEARPGQVDMAVAVADAVDRHRHLVVRAGTGTGKSLAYLVPVILASRPVVVATATKALQDQLAGKDLPFLTEHLDVAFESAVLKGRSNYLCRQRAHEATADAEGQLALEGDLLPSARDEVRRLAAWAETTETGDQAELDWAPSTNAWRAVSVTAEECPGASRCPFGDTCFAEAARQRAAEADVIVVNTHLYGMHVASGGALLPEHAVVVFDEAHQLEDVISDTAGFAIGAGRFTALARIVERVIADDALTARLANAGDDLASALAEHHGRRLRGPLPSGIADAVAAARLRVGDALGALKAIDTDVVDANQRKIRAQKAAGSLAADLDLALAVPSTSVAWVGGPPGDPRLEVAPIDVGPVLAEEVWAKCTGVLTSATIPANLPGRVGLPVDGFEALDVGSPFDYEAHSLLYCAAHLPDPRNAAFEAGAHEELAALIAAAGGRTLALFTSWRAMNAAVDALRPVLPYRILTQSDLPKPALLRAFAEDETSCLFATVGLFQGVDVPGATLSLVTIDRLPFPRPDDPLLEARRERAGAAAFREVDLPRAATLLAQAAGRLIRSATDRGVVAVLDPRLAKAGYRWDVVRALPPMRRTRHRAEVESFLRSLPFHVTSTTSDVDEMT